MYLHMSLVVYSILQFVQNMISDVYKYTLHCGERKTHKKAQLDQQWKLERRRKPNKFCVKKIVLPSEILCGSTTKGSCLFFPSFRKSNTRNILYTCHLSLEKLNWWVVFFSKYSRIYLLFPIPMSLVFTNKVYGINVRDVMFEMTISFFFSVYFSDDWITINSEVFRTCSLPTVLI